MPSSLSAVAVVGPIATTTAGVSRPKSVTQARAAEADAKVMASHP